MNSGLLSSNTINQYHHLDWTDFISLLNSFTYFELNKSFFNKPLTSLCKAEIELMFDSLDYFINNIDSISSICNGLQQVLPQESTHYDFLSVLSKRPLLDMTQINCCANLFSFSSSINRSLDSWKQIDLEDLDFNNIQRKIIKPLRSFVDPDGTLHLEKHPLLKEHFLELAKIESRLRKSLSLIMQSESYADHLQYSSYDIVNDHYVIPVRSDAYSFSLGPIISKSSSGATLYIEPPEVKKMCNRRIQLLAIIDEVIQKICMSFSDLIHHYQKELESTHRLLLLVDQTMAKALLSKKLKLVRPELNHSFEFTLIDFVHPLIDDAVPNSLSMKESDSGIIISGPNTGGKTVALKSIAFCNLLIHMGLFIPAKSASLYPAREIYFFAHDRQNILEGLSSFSSEATNYLQMLSSLPENSLIFIDEIFNSTSSEDASALTLGLLDEINSLANAKTLITTHHSYLKTFIHNSNEYISAHVGISPDGHTPTYKLIYGTPGSSLALPVFESVAKSLGLNSKITDVAKKHISKQQLSYEHILTELAKKESRLDQLIDDNTLINLEISAERKRVDGILFLEKEKLTSLYEKKLRAQLDKAESLYLSLKKDSPLSKAHFYRQVSELKIQFSSQEPPQGGQKLTMPKADLHSLKIGCRLFHIPFQKDCTVQAINLKKRSIQVSINNKSLWVSIDQLSTTHNKKNSHNVIVNVSRGHNSQLELDLRGLRRDDFLTKCLVAIDDLKIGEIPYLTIIHGHGDGILKKALRDLLKNDPDITWSNDEGNDGATRIQRS